MPMKSFLISISWSLGEGTGKSLYYYTVEKWSVKDLTSAISWYQYTCITSTPPFFSMAIAFIVLGMEAMLRDWIRGCLTCKVLVDRWELSPLKRRAEIDGTGSNLLAKDMKSMFAVEILSRWEIKVEYLCLRSVHCSVDTWWAPINNAWSFPANAVPAFVIHDVLGSHWFPKRCSAPSLWYTDEHAHPF